MSILLLIFYGEGTVIGGSSADEIWAQGRWTEKNGSFRGEERANWVTWFQD